MTHTTTHARIPKFPYAPSLQGARLDNLQHTTVRGRNALLLDYQQFISDFPPTLLIRNGKVIEVLQGRFVPRRLRFTGVEKLEISGVYENFKELHTEHPAREIRDMLRWIQSGHRLTFYLLDHGWQGPADLRFYAQRAIQEDRAGEPIPASFEREWSTPPPTRTGLIPQTKKLYQRYGGDPITIHLNERTLQRQLFIGGLEIQPESRPVVDAVLNLGEQTSKWAMNNKLFSQDRWMKKGEGLQGMQVDEIRDEAYWVVEHLKAGKRVLVHCLAGMNRSSTVCCAALMLLEGLSAEKALERVREHHPWARPDPYHWLALRWLQKSIEESKHGR